MNFPDNLKYHKEHTWLKVEGETGIIGITEFAQSELGEIVFVDVPNTGNIYKQDDVFGSVEALKTVSDLFMPVTGSVIETNAKLKAEPTLINSDPFGEGWVLKIRITEILEIEALLDAAAYQKATEG